MVWFFFSAFALSKDLLETFFVLTEPKKEGSVLCEGWEKGWWATRLLGRKKDHPGINGTRSPPSGDSSASACQAGRSTRGHRHSARSGPCVQISVSLYAFI